MSISVYVSVSIKLNIFSNMAIIQLISKALTRWCGNLKGPSVERGWTKSAENLGPEVERP
jgi:hypothetical protein